MSFLQAVIMAVLQGVTELFPVSSLGHAVLLPALLAWRNVDTHAQEFLPFIVILHLGTAVALLLFFWRDWIGLLLAVPLTAFVKQVADCHPALLPISNLLAETPRPVPHWAQASHATVTRAIPFLCDRFRARQK